MAEEHGGGKPADFFVGLVDFFAIVLPGAILTFWVYKCIEHRSFEAGKALPPLGENWVTAAMFGVIAYVVGHLLYVIGSLSLDDVYDWWKDTSNPDRWKSLEERQALNEIADEKLKQIVVEAGANDFKTFAPYLRIWSAGAGGEMDRLEADQKFFRGLIVVLLCIWPSFFLIWGKLDWGPWRVGILAAWGLAILMLPVLPFKRLLGPDPKSEKFKQRGWKVVAIGLLIWLAWPFFTWTAKAEEQPQTTQSLSPAPAPSPHSTPAETPSPSPTPAARKAAKSQSSPGPAKESKAEPCPQSSCCCERCTAAPPPHGESHPAESVSLGRGTIGWVAFLLFVALVLSVVRFVQQRLKYTCFIYRAFIVLQSPGPSGTPAGSGEGHKK
jgi:hypothetical protein